MCGVVYFVISNQDKQVFPEVIYKIFLLVTHCFFSIYSCCRLVLPNLCHRMHRFFGEDVTIQIRVVSSFKKK